MFEKSFITDCEGPLTLNDNAFEMSAHFIEDGGQLFKILSLYDDYLVDVVKKENYTRIADFCTGSGALAVSVAVNCREAKVTGYDISPRALDVAFKNKKIHNAGNVDFKILDVINDLDKINDKYDIVISNPPYISRDEMQLLDKTVGEWEPHLALFGGEDGLDFYRVISSFADVFLKEDGVLAFEVGYTQAEDVALIMSKNFCDIKIKKDYGGINRVVWGRFIG